MKNIIEEMLKFGFTEMEAKTYIEVLKNPLSNGYKLAKILEVPRSTVYSCLDNLYKRGAIYLITGKSKSYKAKAPKLLFDEICENYKNSAIRIEKKLESLKEKTDLDEYINIEGYKNNKIKIKQMIRSAKKEIFMNCGMKIDDFKEDLEEAQKRGVRIVIYTVLDDLGVKSDNYELYLNEKFKRKPENLNEFTIKVVSDLNSALIANGDKKEFLGTYSENNYFIGTISTYFHLDIYLNKLEKKFGKNLITEDVLLNSLHENRL